MRKNQLGDFIDTIASIYLAITGIVGFIVSISVSMIGNTYGDKSFSFWLFFQTLISFAIVMFVGYIVFRVAAEILHLLQNIFDKLNEIHLTSNSTSNNQSSVEQKNNDIDAKHSVVKEYKIDNYTFVKSLDLRIALVHLKMKGNSVEIELSGIQYSKLVKNIICDLEINYVIGRSTIIQDCVFTNNENNSKILTVFGQSSLTNNSLEVTGVSVIIKGIVYLDGTSLEGPFQHVTCELVEDISVLRSKYGNYVFDVAREDEYHWTCLCGHDNSKESFDCTLCGSKKGLLEDNSLKFISTQVRNSKDLKEALVLLRSTSENFAETTIINKFIDKIEQALAVKRMYGMTENRVQELINECADGLEGF